MTNDQPPINQRITNIESRLDRLEGEFREQASFLVDGLLALSSQTTALTNRIDRLTEVVAQQAASTNRALDRLVENAEADRSAMRQMQAEIQQIWQYLLSQRPNGHQG